MQTAQLAALRARWQRFDSEILNQKDSRWFLGAHLKSGAVSPFGTVNGREDFRGIQLPGRFRLANCLIENSDFSHADLPEAFLTDSSFINCVFDGANFTSMRQWRVHFTDCSFKKTNFVSAALGADGGTYIRCLFDQAVFSGVSILQPLFDECTFRGCNLRGVDFFMARFVRCKFSGKLVDVQFKGFHPPEQWKAFGSAPPNPMLEVDFSEAIFNDVGFSFQCDLSSVKIPSDGLHVFVAHLHAAMDCVEKELGGVSDPETLSGAAIWIPLLRQFALDQETYVVSGHDLKADGKVFASNFLDLLRRCSR